MALKTKSNRALTVFFVIISVIAVLLFVLLVKRMAIRTVGAQNILREKAVIVIDAGHGGFDPGAVEGNTAEKDINLAIALKLQKLLELSGYTVAMTRVTDCSTDVEGDGYSAKRSDLQHRLEHTEQYADCIFVSIHQNTYSDEDINGLQVFFGSGNDMSGILAQCIQDAVVRGLQPYNEREVKRGGGNLFVLANAECPAVIVECGFMSNPEELDALLDDEYQKQLAFCIADGIDEFYKDRGNDKE